MPLDPHRPRARQDQVDRRLLQGERIPHRSPSSSRTPRRARRAGLGVRSVVEDQYQFILHHKLLWKEGGGRGADDQETPLYPDLRMCSFDRGRTGRRQARVERATRQGTTQPRRPLRSRGVRGLASGGRSTRWSISPGSAPTRGLRAHGCAVGAGGEPAPPGAAPATAGAGRQETTQTTRRLIGGGVAHLQPLNPLPRRRAARPRPEDRGRSTTNHPTQTDRWHGRNSASGKCGGS